MTSFWSGEFIYGYEGEGNSWVFSLYIDGKSDINDGHYSIFDDHYLPYLTGFTHLESLQQFKTLLQYVVPQALFLCGVSQTIKASVFPLNVLKKHFQGKTSLVFARAPTRCYIQPHSNISEVFQHTIILSGIIVFLPGQDVSIFATNVLCRAPVTLMYHLLEIWIWSAMREAYSKRPTVFENRTKIVLREGFDN